MVVDVTEHFVNAEGALLVLLFHIERIDLSVEFLTVYLTIEVKRLHRLLKRHRILMIHAIQKKPMAFLQQLRQLIVLILLHYLIPIRLHLMLNISTPPNIIGSQVSIALVVFGSTREHLKLQPFVRQLRTLKHIAEIRGAHDPVRLIMLLHGDRATVPVVAALVGHFEMEFQVVFALELFLAESAGAISFAFTP